MKHPNLLVQLFDTFLDNLIGVEIGVDQAETTLHLLKTCKKLKHLYAIDPYIGRANKYNEIKLNISKFDNCELIRKTSQDAVSDVSNELDFIFIDGDHSYEGVKSDLENYVPKIKSGGMLVGHDWTCVRKNFGVVQAGVEFLSQNENLFNPLFTNDELKNMGLDSFQRGGWYEKFNRHLIHKKRPSRNPLWWLIKR